MSDQTDPNEQLVDTGDFLEVPEDQRLDEDPGDEPNPDEGLTLDDLEAAVPDGDVVRLSTADLDEREG